MTSIRKIAIGLMVAAATVSMAVSGANAGGLFGDGGLIRGDVGRIMAPVQQHVLTPVVQGAVVGVGAAAGAVGGGYVGGPTGAAVGSAAGAATGNWVNGCFAGRC